jgi:hypothetical protein
MERAKKPEKKKKSNTDKKGILYGGRIDNAIGGCYY